MLEPLTLTLAVGGVVAVLALGGISLRVFRRPNSGPSGVLKSTNATQAAADPTAINPGDHLTLEEMSDTYLVTAVAVYVDAEDEDDRWYEYELRDEVGDKTLYLSVERDDEDRWRWCVHDVLEEAEVLRIPELAEVTFTSGKPPRKPFTVRGTAWRPANDGYNYPASVTDRRQDRPDPSSYQPRISDYVDGDRELSVELWKGGRCVSIGRPLSGRVLR